MSRQHTEYDLPLDWEVRQPPAGVVTPLDLTKSSSKEHRAPVLQALKRAGPDGLTLNQCGDIAYGSDKDKRKKQRKLVLLCCDSDGHSLAFSPDGNRVALAHFFQKPKVNHR